MASASPKRRQLDEGRETVFADDDGLFPRLDLATVEEHHELTRLKGFSRDRDAPFCVDVQWRRTGSEYSRIAIQFLLAGTRHDQPCGEALPRFRVAAAPGLQRAVLGRHALGDQLAGGQPLRYESQRRSLPTRPRLP